MHFPYMVHIHQIAHVVTNTRHGHKCGKGWHNKSIAALIVCCSLIEYLPLHSFNCGTPEHETHNHAGMVGTSGVLACMSVGLSGLWLKDTSLCIVYASFLCCSWCHLNVKDSEDRRWHQAREWVQMLTAQQKDDKIARQNLSDLLYSLTHQRDRWRIARHHLCSWRHFHNLTIATWKQTFVFRVKVCFCI